MLPYLALCPGPATVYMMRQPFYISLYMRLKLQKIEETVYIVGGNIKCATDDKNTSVTIVIRHVLMVIS